MERTSEKRAAGLVVAAIVGAIVAGAIALATASGSGSSLDDADQLRSAELAVSAQDTAGTSINRAIVVAQRAADGVASADEVVAAVDLAAADVGAVAVHVDGLSNSAFGTVEPWLETWTRAATDIFGHIESGDPAAANAAFADVLSPAGRQLADRLLTERNELADKVADARSSLRWFIRVGGFLVVFLLPAAAILVYRLSARRQVADAMAQLDARLEAEKSTVADIEVVAEVADEPADEPVSEPEPELETAVHAADDGADDEVAEPVAEEEVSAVQVVATADEPVAEDAEEPSEEPDEQAEAESVVEVEPAIDITETTDVEAEIEAEPVADDAPVLDTLAEPELEPQPEPEPEPEPEPQPELLQMSQQIDSVIAEFVQDGKRVGGTYGDGTVMAVPALVDRVLQNLINNGLEHGDGDVRVYGDVAASNYVIAVEDMGPGLSEDVAAAFADGQPVPGSDDTGLTATRALLEQIGGTLDYERIAGRSSFVVWLPITWETADV